MHLLLNKEHEGLEVYLAPQGNNARYSEELKKAIIIKVNRVNVDIQFEGYQYNSKLRKRDESLRGMDLREECNGGYDVYLTLEDYEKQKELTEMLNKIRGAFQWNCPVNYEDACKIIEMIEKNKGEE